MIDKLIEKAIRETLVIQNPQSIYIAIEKIKKLIESDTTKHS